MSEHDDLARMEKLSKWPVKDFVELSAIPYNQRTAPQQRRLEQSFATLKRQSRYDRTAEHDNVDMAKEKAVSMGGLLYGFIAIGCGLLVVGIIAVIW